MMRLIEEFGMRGKRDSVWARSKALKAVSGKENLKWSTRGISYSL